MSPRSHALPVDARPVPPRLLLPFFALFAVWFAPPAASQTPDLGPNARLNGKRVFPPDNPWNQDVSALPVDSNSDALIASIGLTRGLHPDFGTFWDGAPNGIPYVIVSGTQQGVRVAFEYADESDPGPYPVPPNAPIEGGPNGTGDRHVLVLDRDNWLLYELFSAFRQPDGSWYAGSGAIFDLNSNALRPHGWTSADAAGLPIFPGLVRYEEVVERGAINHALRFTVSRTRRAYTAPARHLASTRTDPNLPPMGMRVRLKANFDISRFPAPVRVILTAMKRYGMIVADNGSSWFVSGSPDPRWNDDELATLGQVPGSAFEVVKMGEVITDVVAPPAVVQAEAGQGQVRISWSASAGATGYVVKRATTPGGPYQRVAENVVATTWTESGLPGGIPCYYVVASANAVGQSLDSDEVTATPTLATAALSGTITLPQWVGPPVTLNVTCRPDVGAAFSRVITLGAGGGFTLTNIPRGRYTLVFKGDRWLGRALSGVDCTAGDVSGLSARLKSGDLNGDNSCNFADFDLFLAAFGLNVGEAGFASLADLNGDATCDFADFDLFLDGFGQNGDG